MLFKIKEPELLSSGSFILNNILFITD